MRKNATTTVPKNFFNKSRQCPQGEVMRKIFFAMFIAVLAFSVSGCFPMANDDNNTGINGKDGEDGKDGVGIVSVEYVGVDAQGGNIYKINLKMNCHRLLR